jgi:ribose transport system ATP-binding protein
MDENNLILQLSGITKIFPGTKALDKVDLSIRKGEVHAIMGENGAGKSTLFNVIAGVFPPDEGKIFFDGQEVVVKNPHEAQMMGIGFVHQELSLCSHLNVAENIYINRLPKSKMKTIDFSSLSDQCRKILSMFNAGIKPFQRVDTLNVAQQQVVEILKALSYDCKLLILDEPTSSLTEREVTDLFKVVRQLKDQGISVLYISHRMSEIFEICDRVTVLRDGRYISTMDIKDTNNDKLISQMVGRTIDKLYPAKCTLAQEELLRVDHFSAQGLFDNISFNLRKGEILGFSGLVGSGRSELMRAVCAIDRHSSGNIYIRGKKVNIRNYQDSIKNGLVYMTEDRKLDGLFLNLSIKLNISAAVTGKIRKGITIDKQQESKLGDEYMRSLDIKSPSVEKKCGSLSGGNQQKVLLAKWLAAKPEILIIDEPTRGIDVNVKTEIYKLLRRLCDEGVGIIVITSELQEAIGICDRIIIMREGMITGIAEGGNIGEENIMRCAAHVS